MLTLKLVVLFHLVLVWHVPNIQEVKRSAIKNGAIVAEGWKNERGLSLLCNEPLDPSLPRFSPCCRSRAYRSLFRMDFVRLTC